MFVRWSNFNKSSSRLARGKDGDKYCLTKTRFVAKRKDNWKYIANLGEMEKLPVFLEAHPILKIGLCDKSSARFGMVGGGLPFNRTAVELKFWNSFC